MEYMFWRPAKKIPTGEPKRIILLYENECICIGWYIHNSRYVNEHGDIPNVTHWMPLPDPPGKQ